MLASGFFLAGQTSLSAALCINGVNCGAMVQRGVGELLAVGNGDVYQLELIERWWWSSDQTAPLVQQGFLGTPASLPFHSLYGLGEPDSQLPMLAVLGAALFFLSGLWAGGLLFATALLVGAWTWSGAIEASPSLFFACGSLLVWVGLKRQMGAVAALGLVFVSFRLEWVLWGLLLLAFQRQWKILLAGGLATAGLWWGASMFWGPGLTEQWLLALHAPPDQVQPGLGLIGIVPGNSGAIIPYWWVLYAGAFAAFWKFCVGMKPADAWAFSLAVTLWMSPQIQLVDYALLSPLFVAFFPKPERVALFFGLGFCVLAFVGILSLVPVFVGYGIYLSTQQAHSEM